MKENQCNFVFMCDICDAIFVENHLLIEHKGTHMEIKSEAIKSEHSSEIVENKNAEIYKYEVKAETDTSCKVTEERHPASESEHFLSSKRDGYFPTNTEVKRKVRRKRRTETHKSFETPPKKESLAKQHPKKTPKSRRCNECGKKFSNETRLQKHLALLDKMNPKEGASQDCTTDERDGESYRCSDCAESFDNKCQFQAHLSLGKEWRLFQCPHCNRLFSLAHCNLQDQMCPLCGKNAPDLVDFRTRVLNLKKQKSYQCEVCDKSFDEKKDLIRHAWRHTDRKPHQCQHCDKSFVEKDKLSEHVRTHTGEKPYQCVVCGRTFAQKLGLDSHVRTHSGEKPFQCTDCGRSFADKSNLKTHLLSHTGERLHKCSECGKAFGTGFRLKRHMRIHSGEKPYQCSECGKSFTTSKTLGIHRTVHSGERRHKCAVCDKTFSQKSALNTHKLTHTGEKPHECIQCGKRFVQRPHLKKHLKFSCPSTKTRGAEVFSCFVCRVLFTDPTREEQNSKVSKREMCTKCSDALRRGETLSDLYKRHDIHEASSEPSKTSSTAQNLPGNHANLKGITEKSTHFGIFSRIQSQLSKNSEDDVNDDNENNLFESDDELDNFEGFNLDVQTPNRDDHQVRFISEEKQSETLGLAAKKEKQQNSYGDNFQRNDLLVNSVTKLNTQTPRRQSRGVVNVAANRQTGYTSIRNQEYDSDDGDDGIADFLFSTSDFESICKEEDYDSDKTIDMDLSSNNDGFSKLNSTTDTSGEEGFKGTKSESVTTKEEHVSGGDGDGSDSDRTVDMTFSDDETSAAEISSNSKKSRLVNTDGSENTVKNQKQYKRKGRRKSAKSAKSNTTNKNVLLYQCLECNKIFSLRCRPEERSGNKDVYCPRCKLLSTKKVVDFVKQLRRMKKKKSFKCAECDKDCGRKFRLLRHAWTHCDVKPYQCDQCDMSFLQNNKLTSHMRKHTGEKPYQCDLCDKTFTHKGSLDHHTRLHKGEKPYQCSTCGSAFVDMSSLRIHVLSHSNEKSHKCTECGKAFGTGFRLKRHMRIHTGEKPYQCNLCGKAFTTSNSLGVHRTVHSGERRHKCAVCDKTFSQKSALNTHKLTHTGEKPHECIQCGKRFVQRPHLKKHLKFSCPSK